MKYPYNKGKTMWNSICRWFMMHYVPKNQEKELADALFNLKYPYF